MDDDQFQALVLEHLACIDTKISEIRERLARLETIFTIAKRGRCSRSSGSTQPGCSGNLFSFFCASAVQEGDSISDAAIQYL